MGAIDIIVSSLLAALPGNAAIHDHARFAEQRTALRLQRIAQDPPRLRMFLQRMPKGGNLHSHAGGAIYAEDFLRWAAEAGLCLSTSDYRIVDPPCDTADRVSAHGLERDYPRYSRAIDAFSTRGFETGVGDPSVSGYDRFFATFGAFGPAARGRGGEQLSLVRRQSAADRISYVELNIGSRAALPLVAAAGPADTVDLDTLWRRIEPALPAAVSAVRAEFDADAAVARRLDGCAGSSPARACAVDVRFLLTALRTAPPPQVFAQLALGFALAKADPRFVGVNIAAPEHDPVAVRDYGLHMRMLAWLRARFPGVALSLHAGELTLGLVPPRELAFHIDDAVAIAGARRIGHGIDLPYETNADALLRRMARDQIAVEVNLTSNAVILGVKGRAHPLSVYRAAGVPVVLGTDDEGVSRSDMTNEFQRAVTEQKLGYLDLKQMVRASLHYAFVPGASLWQDRPGGRRTPACRDLASDPCAAFLRTSPKAALQRQLERDLNAFEDEQSEAVAGERGQGGRPTGTR